MLSKDSQNNSPTSKQQIKKDNAHDPSSNHDDDPFEEVMSIVPIE